MRRFKDIDGVYLIGEVGINHNGDLQIAKKLIDGVFASSWNCVKFQKRTPEDCVPESQKKTMRDTPWGKMTYLEYRKRVEFGKEEYDYINRYCNEKPLDWTASVWDEKSLKFMLSYKLPFIKLPSAKVTDLKLVEAAAKTGIPIIASTGMSTLDDIDSLVDILKRHASDFALMHTNSAYPTPPEDLNINCVKMLKDRYGCAIGYSGHEYNIEPTVYACVLGATIVERHITLDHSMWGTDQAASLEVSAMDTLRRRVNNINVVLGDGRKRLTASEEMARQRLKA